MKKVAFVAPTFPVLSETFIRTEIDSIESCGHDVCVMTFEKHLSAQKFSYPIYEIGESFSFNFLARISPSNLYNCIKFVMEQQSMPKRSLFAYSVKLASQMAKLNVEHVHAHFAQHTTSHSIAAAKLLGISCSFVSHGHDIYEHAFDIPLKLKRSDFAVAVCNDMKEDFLKLGNNNIKLLHCGVKTSLFKPQSKLKHNKIRLVFLGRLVEPKGVTYLLQSMQGLCETYPVTLDIVGDGELSEELKQQALALGIAKHVNFLGPKEPYWVKENLPQYDCLVAPFCVAQSGLVDTGPLVLKEAMAVGVPVITTNIMGCKEIVAPGTGLMVNEKDATALAQAIERFVRLPAEKREQMGQEARRNVERNFDAFKQAKILSKWIEAAAH
ncbi:glycosyltransferase [Photobacterium alginatilyticum]|uniref:Colanic acid biosynthesis glycosyltransferase WcaL n=1 Tax=Photobacterium alginatilyticum TaxID=1775171 RepID=A0ABW9YLS9_9GAMM|nr:glycosyltransferase [Photobacterium alginatilyticum]NBI54766.1 colanic acid biosynthesis glycosyltransferase WcaL [Photobacterium alginatilyticum]